MTCTSLLPHEIHVSSYVRVCVPYARVCVCVCVCGTYRNLKHPSILLLLLASGPGYIAASLRERIPNALGNSDGDGSAVLLGRPVGENHPLNGDTTCCTLPVGSSINCLQSPEDSTGTAGSSSHVNEIS